MSKFKVDSNADNVSAEPTPAPAAAESHEAVCVAQTSTGSSKDEAIASAATIGVVAVGAALIEAALIPGIIIGVAAALAPKYVPQIGTKLRPLFKSTVGGVYKLGQKTREAVAETKERMHAFGNEPYPTTPEEFRKRLADDIELWTDVAEQIHFEKI